MKLDTLHRMHARHLAALRRSPATIEFYRFALEPLEKFLHEQDLEPDADLVTRGLLQEFQLWLRTSRGLQPGGEHAVMRGLRATFRWAHEEELIARDPTAKLRLPTLPQEHPPAVQPDEVERCLRVATGMPQPLRNRALLLCLYDTGLRLGEVIALRVEDVNMETGLITVRAETAKRQKARVVPMGVKTAKAMNAYERKERRPVVPHVREMFLSRTGEPMTRGVLTHLMCKVASTAGLPRAHTAPHAWRHGFATQYLRNGGDMFSLQQIMGHTSLEMVRRYVRFLPDDLQNKHLRSSPVDHLGKKR
ncbi:tyrosine recombinase XerD [Deinococcus malanensis]|uniref:Tyrosine recombinase XerD n=1 Tax=Deinococcus malanensis TaxID=1706855 RepID=A0ABQ2ES13_9DEIO|nr:tyrosine-type recombinase/integrase [Deinococcus malanensis]GGK19540.1 tyrosine recombinase XerD [Deinococcus malanensis]